MRGDHVPPLDIGRMLIDWQVEVLVVAARILCICWLSAAGVACGPVSVDPGAGTSAPDVGGDGIDSAAPAGPVTIEEHVPAMPDEVDGWMFQPTTIHEIAITLSEDSVAALAVEPYTYVPGMAVVAGQIMPEVGVRLRGRIGSYRPLTGKPKLRIDFNQYIEDQRFWGHESITLNNSVADCSHLKEPLTYMVFRELGIPASRTAYARVSVNGADYGLYVMVESVDDRFLRRHYDEWDGNLYDGKYIWYSDGSYTLLDFLVSTDTLMELEEGEDVGHADVRAVTNAVAAGWGTESFDETLEPVMDLEHLHWLLAGEQWTGQNDGYAININNYWTYFDPGDGGRAYILPWDLDHTLRYASDWGRSWVTPTGAIASGCWRDSGCAANQRAVVIEALAIIDAMDLATQVALLSSATWGDVQTDPRRECTTDQVEAWRAYVAAWVDRRSGEMRTHWGIE